MKPWDDFQVKGECPWLKGVKRALLNPDVKSVSFRRLCPDMVNENTTFIYHAAEEFSIPIEVVMLDVGHGVCYVRKIAFEDWEVTSPSFFVSA